MRRICSIMVGAFAAAILIAAQIAAAHADIVDSTPTGFQLKHAFHVNTTPVQVYATLIQPNLWWSGEHSYSGEAENFSLDARAGGCWCEKWADNSVQHMTIVLAEPGKILRLRGGLGPLQGAAVDGVMTWTLTNKDGGTDVTLDSAFGGYMKSGLGEISKSVDRVLGEQVTRLKRTIETGSPASKP